MWAQADCTEMKSQQEVGTSGFEVAQPAGVAAARSWMVLEGIGGFSDRKSYRVGSNCWEPQVGGK